jgi:S-adenosylmethionine/arginine decarboxylase-like enzyme
MKEAMTSEDKALLKELYGLDRKEITAAERLYYRTDMSICACGANIMKKRNHLR